MAGVGAPVIFIFQGSRSSLVLSIREMCCAHGIHTDVCWQCWRTTEISDWMIMQADTIRNQRVYPPQRHYSESVVLVDDPAPFSHAEGMVLSERENIV